MSSEEGTRFSEYTPTDHQAPLWIATSITLAYAGLFLIVRLTVKIKVLALDDLFLGVAHVLGVAQWGTMFAALNHGVGKSIVGVEQTTGAKLVFISRILTLLTIGFSKCSIILFLRQFFTGTAKKDWSICTGLLVGTGFWTVASILATVIGCPPSGALLLESRSHCTGDLTRWRVVAGLDVCFEIVLVMIPAYLFYSVQISRTRKFVIFGSFFPRIVVPAIFIAYLEAYIHFRKYGGTSIDAVGTLVWQQILCGYSLVSATTPCLKGFLGRFHTEDLARVTEGSYSGTRTYGQNSRHNTHPETYVLESLDRKNSQKRPPKDIPAVLACRPPDVMHSATAFTDFGDNGDGSVKSFGSERMMIHRKVEYDVTSS